MTAPTRISIPPDERRLLDTLRMDRDGIYTAWAYGRLYGRGEVVDAYHEAFKGLPPVVTSRASDGAHLRR
jgi:hypothetical protein